MALFESAATSAKFFERKFARLRLPISYASVKWQIAVLDALVIVASCIAGSVGYHLVAVPNFIPEIEILAGVGILAASFYILVGRAFGLYEFQCLMDSGLFMMRIIGSWALSVLLLSLVLFLLKVGASSSRGAVVSFALLGALAIAL